MPAPTPPEPASTDDQTERPDDNYVWSFRGYNLKTSEFVTSMVHFYRGELSRSNLWRGRLDTTTNWGVVTTGAALSFTLSDPTHHYGVIILNTLLITLFLWMETRRYRYYELWSRRVRLMETDFFAAMLVPPFAPSPEWAENLAESLLNPEFPISFWEAFGRRFRRNYMWIFLILGIAWALKSYIHPAPALSVDEFLQRSSLGPIPGWAMIAAGLVYNGLLFAVGFATTGLTQATGEVLPKTGDFPVLSDLWHAMEVHEGAAAEASPRGKRTGTGPSRKRQQLLAFIVATRPQAVSERILKDMRRGVTALHGQGMYTHQAREVLMVAVTVTELENLKALVRSEDPNAFVIVSPAKEILGRGFKPLGQDQK